MSQTYVQGISGYSAGSVANFSLTMPGASTPGNIIFAGVSGNFSTCTVSDTVNTYTQDVEVSGGSGTHSFLIRALVTTGATLTIKVTPASSTLVSMSIDEINPGGTVALGNVESFFGTNTTPTTSSCPISGSGFFCSSLGTLSTTAPTAGGAFTVGQSLGFVSAVNYGVASEYAFGQSSALAPNWSQSSAAWACCIASYIVIPSGGAGLFLPSTLSIGSGGPFFQTPVNG